MQKLAEICLSRPVFASMLILAMVVAGAVGFFHLPVDRYPAYDLPTVTVRTVLPGASAEEVEVTVSYPIEEAVNTVEGIDELRSINASGTSLVLITFSLDRDIDTAAQDVRDRVAQAVRQLPRDAEPPIVGKFDNDSTPVLTLALSGPRALRELTELADKRVKRALERSPGVGEVRIVGGLSRTVNVWLDADRLAAYDLPVTRVREALARQNTDVPGGNVTGESVEQTLRTMGRVVDPDLFDDLVIETRDGAPIRIRDIGDAEDGTEEQRSLARLDGQPTVVLEIRRQSGANTIAVIDGVTARLDRLRESLPADLGIEVIRDQSRYIRQALHEIEVHLVVGSLLASIVVLFFLRSWRATLVAAVAIPASVVTTFAVMWALDFTLNSITMLALVLMVGVVIDDAIVVLENVHRWATEKGMTPFEAAKGATKEIGLAVMATTLSLVVIFVPVSFMSSISGRFLYQFGITAAAAVMVSLVVSFTLTPMMSARMLRPGEDGLGGGPGAGHGAAAAGRGAMAGDLAAISRGPGERLYLTALRWCLRHPWITVLAALPVVASSWFLYPIVPQDYIPSDVDEGEFEVNVNGPEGANLAAMDRAMHAVEEEIAALRPRVTTMLTTVGGGFLSGISSGSVYVRIEPHSERLFSFGRLWRSLLAGEPLAAFRDSYTQREVMSEIRRRLRSRPEIGRELRTSVRNQRSMNLGGGPFELDFAIRGPDLQQLVRYAEELKAKANAAGGMVDLDTTLRLSRPELRVEIDRARAADLGIDTQDIAAALRVLVGGDLEVSRFRDRALDEEYDVRLRLRPEDRSGPERIGQLLVPRAQGAPIRLDNVVQIERAESASRIDRLDRQRQTSIRGSIAPGYALADRIATLRGLAEELRMPAEYTTAVSGRARELEKTFDEFVLAFVLSLAFMYMILAAQFESVWQPAIILASLPLAAPFALLSLLVAGQTLNLYSALGVLVLFGMVKKNAILQIDHGNQLHRKGLPPDDAVLLGSRDRLRPILMTTLAFVAGMLPLALGTGPGAEERKAIAVVVIGGQMLSLVLTLLLTPVLHRALLRRRDVRAASLPGEPVAEPAPAEPPPSAG